MLNKTMKGLLGAVFSLSLAAQAACPAAIHIEKKLAPFSMMSAFTSKMEIHLSDKGQDPVLSQKSDWGLPCQAKLFAGEKRLVQECEFFGGRKRHQVLDCRGESGRRNCLAFLGANTKTLMAMAKVGASQTELASLQCADQRLQEIARGLSAEPSEPSAKPSESHQ